MRCYFHVGRLKVCCGAVATHGFRRTSKGWAILRKKAKDWAESNPGKAHFVSEDFLQNRLENPMSRCPDHAIEPEIISKLESGMMERISHDEFLVMEVMDE
jgi:hypothetical protein